MPGQYARGTEVSTSRSRDEIERTLTRFGATGFTYGWEETEAGNYAAIMFKARGRLLRFLLPLPKRADFRFTEQRRLRTSQKAIDDAYDQAAREKWRALALIIKAKLVAVEAGVVTFEQEFLSHMVLPSGRTVAETIVPQLDEAYASGQLPSIVPLPQLPAPDRETD